jgi:alkylated DNA repair dioxygenase AlkB
MRRNLPSGGSVELLPAWLDADAAKALQQALLDELTWESREVVLFGRRILQPRLVAWGGDVPYRYSGQTLERRAMTASVAGVVERVNAHTGVRFNHVLVNRYRNGMDSMGMHSDDEPELGPDPVVASVSVGATRRFVLVPKRGKGEKITLPLGAGSLLVMGVGCQASYRHGIPKDPSVHGERISLTLRRILPARDT